MATFGPIAAALVEEGCSAEQVAAAVMALETAREREERLARLREGDASSPYGAKDLRFGDAVEATKMLAEAMADRRAVSLDGLVAKARAVSWFTAAVTRRRHCRPRAPSLRASYAIRSRWRARHRERSSTVVIRSLNAVQKIQRMSM
ncbi:hypothetical protein [Methylocella sp.]|uniref:hypothetical protein n=1 Tax=Methylocella sp. TaxID=1978226 RepID=UPI00378314B9